MSGTGWTEDRVALLRQYFEGNRSVTMMSKEFGISRGAVIGKLHRLGLRRGRPIQHQKSAEEILAATERRRVMHNEAQNKRRQAGRGNDAAPSVPSIVQLSTAEYAPLGIPFADLEPFRQRKANQCRYMAAEEPSPEYRVCGIETAPSQPYCAHCKTIVHDYRKPTDAEQARLRNLSRLMKTRHAMRSGA